MTCCRSLLIISVVFLAFLIFKIKNTFNAPPVPKIEETWWSNGNPNEQDKTIRPFKISVSEKVLKDLKYRLDNHIPFTPPLEPTQWYGMNTDLLNEIVNFWRTKYNWTEREKLLNQYDHFLTNIQGLDIHYIHVKPKNTKLKVLPLLLLHGWPGSVREFYDAIPLLTTPQKDRKFVFEVIIPSLPGYGFSQAAVKPGLGATQMAVIFKNLMQRLGFNNFYVQGGDFGAIILHSLSVMYPERVLGFHSNMCYLTTLLSQVKIIIGALWPTLFTRADHLDRVYPVLGEQFDIKLQETGYLHLQASKPDTIGVALKDSPVGLAAYILEKFSTGANLTYRGQEDGGLKKHFKYEDLLDNVMIYWVTGSMPTAIRLYAETFNKNHLAMGTSRIPIQVPTACARFQNDFYSPDGVLGEIYLNLLQLTDYVGGHFAAFQLPDIFAKDVYMAIEKFEQYNSEKLSGKN